MLQSVTVDYTTLVEQAAESLATTNFHASPEAQLKLSQYDGVPVGIVELPQGTIEALETTPKQLAESIQSASDPAFSIIVVYTKDAKQFGISSDYSPMTTTAYQTILGADGVTSEEALVNSFDQLKTLSYQEFNETSTEAVTSELPNLGVSFATLGGTVMGLMAVFLAIALGINFFTSFYFSDKLEARKRRNEEKRAAELILKEAEKSSLKADEFTTFRSLLALHKKLGYQESSRLMETTAETLEELFKRLRESDNSTKLEIATVEYSSMLERLNNALSEKYYLNILANPNYWSNPKKRINEVHRALEVMNALIIRNIQQHNSSQDLDFRVGLESILNTEDQTDPIEMTTPKNQPQSKNNRLFRFGTMN